MRALLWLPALLALGISSCIPQKSVIYLQDKTQQEGYVNPYRQATEITENYKIQVNDYLYVRVITGDPELEKYYNLSTGTGQMSTQGGNSMKFSSYLVADNGCIDFPYLGDVPVQGLTLSQAKARLSELLSKQIDQYTLQVQLTNTFFTVLGEAGSGMYPMNKDQLTIYEALAMAGDLKTYSKRNKVKIIRKGSDGVSSIREVDLTDKNLLDSQESYILPNDIVYVEPIKAKMLGFGETFSLGLVTTLISFYLLILSL